MDYATKYTIETTDRQIASIAEKIQQTILNVGMTKDANKLTVDSITKDIGYIQEFLKIRNKLFEQ